MQIGGYHFALPNSALEGLCGSSSGFQPGARLAKLLPAAVAGIHMNLGAGDRTRADEILLRRRYCLNDSSWSFVGLNPRAFPAVFPTASGLSTGRPSPYDSEDPSAPAIVAMMFEFDFAAFAGAALVHRLSGEKPEGRTIGSPSSTPTGCIRVAASVREACRKSSRSID